MKNISLSVCLIVKNEEKMIEECLLSVKDIADEIILVDTGSTDKTLEIAKKFNCKIIESKWQNDFALARNISIDHATSTHILIIDADERLINPELIIPTIEKSNSDIGGWLIKNISNASKDGGITNNTFVNDILRLFINNKKIRYKGIIHEQIINSIIDNGYKIEITDIKMLHLGYSLDKTQMEIKQKRNLDLLNKQIELYPDDYYSLFQRSKTSIALGNISEAEEDINKFFKIAPEKGTTYPQALNYGAIIAVHNQDKDLAIKRAKKSLELIPHQTFAHFILGDIALSNDDFSNALNHFFQLEFESQNKDTFAHIIGDYIMPYEELQFKIGKSYIGLKDYNNAEKHFKLGNNYNSEDSNNLIGLANIEFINKNYSSAKLLLEKANKNKPNDPEILKYLRQLNNSTEAISLRKEKENLTNQIKIDDIIPLKLNTSNPLISLSMIVKNEAKFLPDCIESVRDVVDEMIIVDTGSTDNTVEIAEKYGATVYHIEWKDDFAFARNESLKHCKGKWVLYLDADERLKEKSKNEIIFLANNSIEKIGGYICNIESLHLQSDGTTDMHKGGYPRFFRNYGYPTIFFVGRIHEQITPSIFALNKAIDFSNIEIKHLGYDTSLEVMEKKVRRNYALLIKHVQDEPENAYAWFQLGQTLGMMQLNKESEDAVKVAIELGTLKSSVACSAYSLLAQYAKARKSFDEALNYCNKSLEIAPEQVYTTFLKALIYMQKGEPEIAEPIIEEVIQIKNRKRGAPHSGFDIELDLDYINKGLEHCRKMIKDKKGN